MVTSKVPGSVIKTCGTADRPVRLAIGVDAGLHLVERVAGDDRQRGREVISVSPSPIGVGRRSRSARPASR